LFPIHCAAASSADATAAAVYFLAVSRALKDEYRMKIKFVMTARMWQWKNKLFLSLARLLFHTESDGKFVFKISFAEANLCESKRRKWEIEICGRTATAAWLKRESAGDNDVSAACRTNTTSGLHSPHISKLTISSLGVNQC
jgi:hypothetical protein